jgi:uncharacterized membrane protein
VSDTQQPADPASPTKDERLLGMLAHILSFSGGGFIAPLVILLTKKDSRFVRFHALQALLMSVAVFGVLFGGFFLIMLVAVGLTVGHAPRPVPGSPPGPPPLAVFLVFPLFFLGMGSWIVASIILGVRANAGQWSALPGFGWLTRKLLGRDKC